MMHNLLFIFKAIIMGVVEGITEFIPISSTAHLIITGDIINFSKHKEFSDMFKEVIQLGAILAIIVLYWDKIWNSLKHLQPSGWGFRLWSKVVVGFLPAMVIGFAFKDKVDEYLMDNVLAVACAMVVGGILLIIFENNFRKKAKIKNMDMITYKQAFIIGCFQCLSMWPGMSRSASTIMGGWTVGLTSFAAAEFSFFLAIPTMMGASFLSIIKLDWAAISNLEVISLAIAFIVSFIVALIVVEKFVNFLKNRPMRIFSLYRILVGIILLILLFMNIM